MSNSVITLVSCTEPLAAHHFNLLRSFGAENPVFLGCDTAADFAINEKPNTQAFHALRAEIHALKTDIFISDEQNRKKRLLLSDMDSTMVKSETLDDVAEVLKLKEAIAAITEEAMAGKIDYITSLEKRVAMLKGLDFKVFDDHLTQIPYMEGGKTLVKTMRQNGATTVLVSSGFDIFTNYVAEQMGFEHNHGNSLIIRDGKLTGEVKHPVLDGHVKNNILKDYINTLGLSCNQTLAIGDGANDLHMLKTAQDGQGFGFGYHPKPILQETLDNYILYNDLTASLFAQGYSKDEFITQDQPK